MVQYEKWWELWWWQLSWSALVAEMCMCDSHHHHPLKAEKNIINGLCTQRCNSTESNPTQHSCGPITLWRGPSESTDMPLDQAMNQQAMDPAIKLVNFGWPQLCQTKAMVCHNLCERSRPWSHLSYARGSGHHLNASSCQKLFSSVPSGRPLLYL